jgi:hypothetical protein
MQHLPDSYSPPDLDKPESRRTPEHFTGCLLGGAVGDVERTWTFTKDWR